MTSLSLSLSLSLSIISSPTLSLSLPHSSASNLIGAHAPNLRRFYLIKFKRPFLSAARDLSLSLSFRMARRMNSARSEIFLFECGKLRIRRNHIF